MHICFLCNEYPPHKHGGVGTVTQTLARGLASRGHRATVVGVYADVAAVEQVTHDGGATVLRLPHAPIRGLGLLVNGVRLRRALRRIHDEHPIDVIEGPENSLALLPRRFPARRVIRMNGGHHFFATTLAQTPRAWRSWLERRSFDRADALCAVSRYVATTTVDLLGLNARPVEILPNAVDASLFRPREDVAEENGLLMFVGTLTEKKGVRQLAHAMSDVLRAVPDARLEIVGRDRRDPKTGQLFSEGVRATLPPDVAARITFRGAVPHDELPVVMARASVCVYPSHMEALPLAWLEGMAMGKAVLASTTGPGPEVIEDGVSGLLRNPHDPRAIAGGLVQLLRDPELRRRLGREARSRVVERFSESALVDRNLRFYERCAIRP